MTVKQISVFLENTAGRLGEVTALLGEGGVNLRAITIADTADFGILRLIVDDYEKALKLFKDGGFTAKVTEVLAIEVADEPGGLARVMKIFEDNNVNIEYLYATLEKSADKAVVIFRVEDIDSALKLIEDHNLTMVSGF
ncbi:MAG: ACT domain-containing protein [Spirochaetia bacterium]